MYMEDLTLTLLLFRVINKLKNNKVLVVNNISGELFKHGEHFNIPPKLVRLIRATIYHIKCQVSILEEKSNAFKIAQVLKQRDELTPMVFNLALEYVLRKIPVDVNSTTLNKSNQTIGYTDNLI